MDSKGIRYQRELARMIGKSDGYINQIFGGYRNMGEKAARGIEAALGLPRGYLDETSNISPAPPAYKSVPLISMVQAGSWCDVVDPYEVGDAEEWVPCYVKCGKGSFAVKVQGISMEPEFKEGEIIIVDPQKPAENRSNVIVRLDGPSTTTFKQLIIEGGDHYLRPLNPDWPEKIIRIDSEATICGVVISKITRY